MLINVRPIEFSWTAWIAKYRDYAIHCRAAIANAGNDPSDQALAAI